MTKDGKNLKLACIACLFVGLAVLVVGVVSGIMQAFDADAIATLVCGAVSAPGGAQSSRLANVPSNVHKIRGIALGLIVVAAIALGVSYATKTAGIAQFVGVGIALLVSLVMLVYAQRITKDLERV